MFIKEVKVINLLDDIKHLEEVSEWIWKEWDEQMPFIGRNIP